MAVFGDSYGQIAQQQMGLDAATANRAIASQQMLREVQRAAVAQRQQEIATQMAAQQQADYAAQREQENQYRMASWLNQLQQQQRNYGLDREQMQYSRGRDVLADAFKNKGYQADINQNKIVNKLRQDEFGLRQDQFNEQKNQLTNAEIVDKRRREEAAIQDQNQMLMAKSLADAMNQVKGSQDVLTELGTSPGKPRGLGKGDMRELYSRLPYDMPVDPQEYLGSTGMFSTPYPTALAKLQSLYQSRMAPFQNAVEGYQAVGGDALVGVRPNGQAYPNFIPRTNLTAPASQPATPMQSNIQAFRSVQSMYPTLPPAEIVKLVLSGTNSVPRRPF